MGRSIAKNFIILLILSLHVSVAAQNNYSVKRGERPPVHFDDLAKEAYEPGKIWIKIKTSEIEEVSASLSSRHSSEFVVTGRKELDTLNKQFHARSYSALFGALSQSKAGNEYYTEKHQAWGFHQWFEITLDADIDVVEAVKQYKSLQEVEIAEPVFRKELIAFEPISATRESKESGENNRTATWVPDDLQYTSQWHYNNTGQQNGTSGADIRLEKAWSIEKGNPDVIVAIIDGGIQTDHPDLQANMWQGIGYNFVNNTSNIIPHNHGTHVAGTVAAVSNNNLGVAGVAGGSGLGDGVRLMSCQVFTANGNGGFHVAPIYAADNGAAISQNSWAYTSAGVYEQAVLDAIDYFNANGGGTALYGGISVFAAGNNNASGLWYPACYSGTFSVAAVNNQDMKAWYSNYDNWIDISAPGGETNQVHAAGVLSTLINNAYGFYQGTSMACPHVSGVAALIVSNAYGLLTSADVAEILRNSADNHYAVNPSFSGMLGSGRLNAHGALIQTQMYINSVTNPFCFNANTICTNSIQLEWVKNINNHDVLLAYSLTNNFGEPEVGQSYVTGQSIPGGGIVIYQGSDTGYLHQNLSVATQYHYKIWSFNDSFEYSSGKTTCAVTACYPVEELPFSENFNQGTMIPLCWDVADHIGNGQVWKVGTFVGKVAGTTGNVAYLNSSAYGFGSTQNSDLITPTLDLSNYENVSLRFRHYYRQYQTSSSATLAYSVDNGTTWINIQTWTSNTSNPTLFNQVIPAVAGKSAVRFKWNFTGTWGYYWSIDDLLISGTYVPPAITPDFIAEPTTAPLGQGIVFTEMLGNSNISTWQWNFGEGAEPQTANCKGPHQVTYSTPGFKTVSLTVDGAYTLVKENYVFIKENFNLTICINGPGNVLVNGVPYSDTLSFPEGTTVELHAVGNDNSTFTGWCSATGCETPVTVLINQNKSITANFSFFSSAIFDSCSIPTDLNFADSSNTSACPGILTVSIPPAAHVTGININYQMTALNSGKISEQASIIRCLAGDSLNESAVIYGIGDNEGTYTYSLSLPELAENVIGPSELVFELHAFRTTGGTGCDTSYNKVDKGTWSVTVLYDVIPAAPDVETLPFVNIAPFSVQVGGFVSCDGGAELLQRGIYWGTEPNAENNGVLLERGVGLGEFYSILESLQPGTTYYYRAYAENTIGNAFGSEFSFTTYSTPFVITGQVSDVTNFSARINFEVVSDGGAEVTHTGIYWGIYPDPENQGNELNAGAGAGIFSLELRDLNPSTTYYYKAYAINSIGKSTGVVASFTTTESEGPPDLLWLADIVIEPGKDTCFSASEQVVVAGEGKFYSIEAGAGVEIVAGQSILLLPGTSVKQGGYLLARISTDGQYCFNPENLMASTVLFDEPELLTESEKEHSSLRIYPNPGNGLVHLRFDGALNTETIQISVFNTLGSRIKEMKIADNDELNLSSLAPGVYLLHVMRGKEIFVEKYIKQ